MPGLLGTRKDRDAALGRARIPSRYTATGNVADPGEAVVVTAIHVVGGSTGSTVELRDGGDGTTPLKWSILAQGGAPSVQQAFPHGLAFDGLHITIPADADEVFICSTIEPDQ